VHALLGFPGSYPYSMTDIQGAFFSSSFAHVPGMNVFWVMRASAAPAPDLGDSPLPPF